MTPISARSRRPTRVEVSMLSSSSRAWSAVSTGVLPRLDDMLRAADGMRRVGGDAPGR